MREIPLTRGLVALVDDQDFDVLVRFKWRAAKPNRLFYAATQTSRREGQRRTLYMHQLILGLKKVDHIDGDGLNNRRSNLRPCNNSQNAANTKKHSGKSKFKGVSWHARTESWRAYIRVNGRQKHLGHFQDETEAAMAYDAAAKLHWRDFARLNFSDGEGRP